MLEGWYEVVEWTAVLLNLLYVILAARKKRICWIVGALASFISILLFIHVKLYAEAVLYFVYVILAYVGWNAWDSNTDIESESILDRPIRTAAITEWPWRDHLILWVIGASLALGTSFIFKMTDAQRPVLDAFTTSFSLIATWLTVKKVLSNWIYWIVIDSVTVFLYHSRGLEVYAFQMFIFAILAAWGFYSWWKEYKTVGGFV